MIAIAFITFRESLEMLLVGSALLALLTESKIERKQDFFRGIITGLVFSFTIFVLISFAGSQIHIKIAQEVSELFEGINYLFSGIFLYVSAILLHNKMKTLAAYSSSLLLDSSLFAVGFLLVLREGVEIILFTLSTSVSSPLPSSLLGFGIGVGITTCIGVIGRKLAISHLSHKKLLVIVDGGIKLLALYFVLKGLIGLSEFVLSSALF